MNFDNFDDDFDFEDFLNDSEKEFQMNLEKARQRMMEAAIENNFNAIKEQGLSVWHLRHMQSTELEALRDTLGTMIEHYVDSEEYEKCALLQKHLNEVIEVAKVKAILK